MLIGTASLFSIVTSSEPVRGFVVSSRSTLKEVPKDKPCVPWITSSSLPLCQCVTILTKRQISCLGHFVSTCSRGTVCCRSSQIEAYIHVQVYTNSIKNKIDFSILISYDLGFFQQLRAWSGIPHQMIPYQYPLCAFPGRA